MSLIEASRTGDLVRVRQLISGSGKADLNITDKNGETPLIAASRYGHSEIVKELLSAEPEGKGADPNFANENGERPLYWASRRGHLEVVKELLRVGADPNLADKYDLTPLYWAIDNRHFDVIDELENYFPSLRILSLISLRKFEVDISSIPKNLLE